jgi:hypothetical protein
MEREKIYVLQDEDGNRRFNGDEELQEYLDDFNKYYDTDYSKPKDFNDGEAREGREDRFIFTF